MSSDIYSDPICHSAGCTQYLHPKPEPGHPVDYPVPNFGRDTDVITTFNSLDVAQKIRNHEWNYDGIKPKPEEPVLYHDGEELDEDINHTHAHMAAAEAKLGAWDYKAI